MSRSLVAIGTAAALAGVGLVACNAVTADTPTYTLTADVEQAPNLFTNGRVMVRGVEVGRITEVEPQPDAVRLTMEIDEGVAVPAGAKLSVVPITVISDRYVQLFPAYSGGARMGDGDHISLEDTAIPAELDDVLTEIQGLLSALEPAEGERRGPLARLIKNFDAALKGHSEDLSRTLGRSAGALDNLARSQSDISKLIRNLDRLFIALANRSSEIGLVNERLALVFEALLADQDELEGTIEGLGFLADEAALLVSAAGDDLGTSFGRLDRVLSAILARQDEVLKSVRWTNVIAESLGATDSSGKGLFAYTGRQVPPGTANAGYNYRIDTRDTIACERINALIQSFLVLNPDATIEELRATLFTFIPDEYDDDLAYLVDLLIPLCADLPDEGGLSLDPVAQQMIASLAAQIGERQLGALLVGWFLEEELP
jgi:phospholipid/cholesterol/gamma-HCH transport system substrate-binding protein